MTESKFRIGDQVRLKSGGPTMMVNGYAIPFGNVECVWINNNGNDKKANYHEDVLEKVLPKKTVRSSRIRD